MRWRLAHCRQKIYPTDRRTGAVACRCHAEVCSAECNKGAAGILPCKQAHRQRMVCPACDECGGMPWQLGTESDVSESAERHTDRTERWKNRCLYVQNENKDNNGDNDNIRENESVTTVQNPQSPSFRQIICQYCTKIKYKSIDF